MCIRRETREKARQSLAFSRVSKPHTHITHMLRQCTRIVYLTANRPYHYSMTFNLALLQLSFDIKYTRRLICCVLPNSLSTCDRPYHNDTIFILTYKQQESISLNRSVDVGISDVNIF